MSESYLRQSREWLKKSFPLISCDAIYFIFDESNFKFSEAYRRLSSIQNNQVQSIENAPNIRVFLKQPRRKPKNQFKVTDADLLREIDLIPELNEKPTAPSCPKEIIEISDSEDEVEGEEENRVECLVCYADYIATEVYDCGAHAGHSVCGNCITRFASEQLHGNNSLEFKCIGDVDCTFHYQLALLEKILPEDLNRQINERTFADLAEQPGMWTCPEGCGYIGFADVKYPWIECPTCNKKYCTSCNEKVHDGRTCDEARMERQRLQDPKQRAHEAMSEACKRFCPHCNLEFMKGDGCNKITCSKCRGISCYLCGEKIESYSHFCNCKDCGKDVCKHGKTCKLWTSADEMEKIDRRKRQEAGRKVLTEAGYTDEKEIVALLGYPKTKMLNAKANPWTPNGNPPPLNAIRVIAPRQIAPHNQLQAQQPPVIAPRQIAPHNQRQLQAPPYLPANAPNANHQWVEPLRPFQFGNQHAANAHQRDPANLAPRDNNAIANHRQEQQPPVFQFGNQLAPRGNNPIRNDQQARRQPVFQFGGANMGRQDVVAAAHQQAPIANQAVFQRNDQPILANMDGLVDRFNAMELGVVPITTISALIFGLSSSLDYFVSCVPNKEVRRDLSGAKVASVVFQTNRGCVKFNLSMVPIDGRKSRVLDLKKMPTQCAVGYGLYLVPNAFDLLEAWADEFLVGSRTRIPIVFAASGCPDGWKVPIASRRGIPTVIASKSNIHFPFLVLARKVLGDEQLAFI